MTEISTCKSCGQTRELVPACEPQKCADCGIWWNNPEQFYYCDSCHEREKFSCGPKCTGKAGRPYNESTYYDASDAPEEMTSEDPSEAIAQYLDDHFYPPIENKTIEDHIRELSPIHVRSYTRKKAPTNQGEAAIDSLLEDFDEYYWCEEFGNAFEGGSPPWGEDVLLEVKKILYEAMERCVKKARVYQCDYTASREYSADEVAIMMKASNPHWWEGEECSQ